nr:MAG TPA: hypothetical protein [Caudoviricetes sp.]
MNKNILPGMSPTYENMARSVVQAQKKINGLNTSPTGTISVHRSNGTKDIYGVLNKDGYSVAKNVGDTVAPPKPKGIFATSSSDVVYVAWDGTLEDKIPSDFYNVTIYMGVGGQSSVIGTLTEPGIVSTPPLPTAQSVEVWATAEDDTCKEDGTPAHNVSHESVHQSVAIEHGSNSQGVEDLKKILEKKIDAVDAKAEQAATDAKGAKTMATGANNTANDVKSTIENLTNVFTHDADGAHIGDKKAGHVTVKSDRIGIFNGESPVASFESNIISLGDNALNIVAGYQDNRGDRATALMTDNILLKPTGHLMSDSQAIAAKISNSNRMHFAELGLTDSTLMLSADNRAKKESIDYTNLIKMMMFVPWTDLVNDQWVRVRYCVRGGMMYLECYMAGGYPEYMTPTQIPDRLLPSYPNYYPLAVQKGNNTAKIWVGAAGGGDGHVYIYNSDRGYCSGVVPIIPKILE